MLDLINKLGGRKFFLCLFGFIAVSVIFICVDKFESNDYVLASVGIIGFYFGTNVFQRNSENRYINRCGRGGKYERDPKLDDDSYSEKG